jgi:hypothetical protein
MLGELNIFQRAMLQWNVLRPYNAVHGVRIAGPLEMARLRQVLETTLQRRGISRLVLDHRHGTYEYQPGQAQIEIREVGATGAHPADLTVALEHELNTPFQIDGPFCPVRFFVIAEPGEFLLGAAYFHPIADAESMIVLLRGAVSTYLGDPAAYPCVPFVCHPPRHDRLWLHSPGLIVRKLLAVPSEIRRHRRSIRMRVRAAADRRTRVRLMRVGGETVEQLVTKAKAWGVTVHDLLLAVLMQGLAPLAPQRSENRRRRNIALGTIVNVRADCGIDRERTFGLFLGSYVVSHPVPAGITLRALATDLRGQTAHLKRHKLFLATPLELALAGRVFNLCSTRRQEQFYQKYHPLAGGISNMRLDAYWQSGEKVKPLDYFRVVATGPTTPLVLSTTTWNRGMTLALSYQPEIFTPAGIEALEERLGAGLRPLEGDR